MTARLPSRKYRDPDNPIVTAVAVPPPVRTKSEVSWTATSRRRTIRPVTEIGHPAKGAIWVKVNGQIKQQGDLSQQIWSVPEQISYLSNLITLRPGDLIFSGTPAGVGPIQKGDKLEGHVDGVGDLAITYAT